MKYITITSDDYLYFKNECAECKADGWTAQGRIYTRIIDDVVFYFQVWQKGG